MKKRRIFITGDTHDMNDWAKLNTSSFPEQKELTKEDVVIICGDAGIVWDQGEQDEYIQTEYSKRNFTTAFVDGNHENHDALDKYPVEIWNGGKIHRISESIIHLMRGQVYTINGKTFFTMGGAESTDKAYRKEGESWWAREMPSDEEYAEALKNLSDNHFVVDYVITHCGPEGILEIFRRENKLTRFLDSLITKYDLCFDRWFCGHYHIDESCEAIQILYDSVVNLGEMRFDAGYKDDEIFLLSSRAHCYYLKEIPPLACWWWIISPRYCNRSWAAPWNGFANEGYEMANDNICAVRPAIKYSNIKNELIKSPDFDDLFYYNNHSFKVIDSESEVAIAVVPIAFDYFDYKHRYYEVSNIRAKLHYWFNTGIWNYKLEQEMPMPKAGFKDDVIFLLSVYEYLNYRDFIPPDENVWWLRDSGGKTDNVAITDGVGQECKYSSVQNYYGIRPAIKYSKLKDSITNSSLSVGRFIFNNHPFRIIDSFNKIAIAEVPIALDMFDYESNKYETSTVRKKLLQWLHYGE